MQGDAARAFDEVYRRLAPLLDRAGPERVVLAGRLESCFGQLFAAMLPLYGHRWDFAWQLEAVLRTALEAALARPERLVVRDRERPSDWIRQSGQIGAMGYVDRCREYRAEMR